jgi:hypothetical protein
LNEESFRLKAGQSLNTLPPNTLSAVITHPAQQANVVNVSRLIESLRACHTPGDYYEFQRYLFGHLYKVEERRAKCSHAVKRLRRGRSLPQDVPPLSNRQDPMLASTWEFEAFVYERLARQLRSVGDGLAWNCFGYDRRLILTLSRNDPAGPMFGKDGLPYELGRVEQLWNEQHHFALLHDLTNCLRIADLTEFADDGGKWLREIKKTPHVESKQLRRTQAAVDAIMSGGHLPGDRPNAKLVEIDEPYVTDLAPLGDLLDLAKKHGSRGMKLPFGRAVIASSLAAVTNRWGDNLQEGQRVLDSTRQRVIRRAKIDTSLHHITGISGDTASRSPIQAPWSIYPFTPNDCAALICDLLIFETVISPAALQNCLSVLGLASDLLLPPEHGQLTNQDVLRVYRNGRALTIHGPSFNQLLYELVKPDSWARGISKLLATADLPDEPVVVFSNEAATWR